MLIKDKIRQTKLTKVEMDIAKYLLAHVREIDSLSTRELAKKTFTSSSAVIRLSNKLGYEGYTELKKDILKEQKYLDSHFEQIDANIPFKKEESMMKVANSMKELMNESAEDTLMLIDHDSLQKAFLILNKSEHIYVFGFGAYVPLAKIFQLKMSRIRKHVIVQDFVGEERYQADMISDKDCAIFISYSGENHTLNYVVHYLKEKGIPTIGITSIGENSLYDLCDCTLRMSTREKLFSKIANYSSEYSVLLILNILYSLCFKENYNENLQYKITHSKKEEINHYSTNEIIQED